jgi:hypothetical protein
MAELLSPWAGLDAEPAPVAVPDFRPRDRVLVLPVLAFFLANPDEELSVADMGQKFSVPGPKLVYATSALHALRDLGLLVGRREGRIALWSAGPALAGWGASANGQLCLEALRSGAKVKHRQRAAGGPAGVSPRLDSSPAPAPKVTPVGALEIRLTLHVHGAGTPFQRVEIAGVEL